MSWLKKILERGGGHGPERRPRQPPPPRPLDWRLTVADLMQEMMDGKRESVGSPEVDWAREYERSQVPQGARFPRKGDVYQLKRNIEAEYLTSWTTPYTGGGKTTLLEGERFWVHTETTEPEPVGVHVLAVDYEELERRVVAAEERGNFNYTGFHFYFDTVSLNRDFDLVASGFDGGEK